MTNCRRFVYLLLLALPWVAERPAHALVDRLLLCGGVEVREGRISVTNGKPQYLPTWQWRPESSPGMPDAFLAKFTNIDDCKPAIDGKELLISAGGAVAIVGFPEGDTRFYAAVPNAHSFALLPQGMVVAAASTHPQGNRLILFSRAHPDQRVADLPLEGAHGVTWDDRRQVLWALGDNWLLKLSVVADAKGLVVLKRYPVESGGGHDLALTQDGKSLLVTTVSRALIFDIDRESFSAYQPLAGLRDVKSISINPSTGQIAYTEADPKVWWTYTLRFLSPAFTIPIETHTYKVRWSTGRP
jgi:hypothetical protein